MGTETITYPEGSNAREIADAVTAKAGTTGVTAYAETNAQITVTPNNSTDGAGSTIVSFTLQGMNTTAKTVSSTIKFGTGETPASNSPDLSDLRDKINGVSGDTGPQGIPGDIGSMGPQGFIGKSGNTGPQGNNGPIGSNGPQGIIGPQGSNGPQGIPGLMGPIGERGIKGDRGDPGERGYIGIQGDIGPRGISGIQGEKGPQGNIGNNGGFFYHSHRFIHCFINKGE